MNFTKDEYVLIAAALEAVSPSGGMTKQYMLARRIIEEENVEVHDDFVMRLQLLACDEIPD